jgi:hypothetical protein
MMIKKVLHIDSQSSEDMASQKGPYSAWCDGPFRNRSIEENLVFLKG